MADANGAAMAPTLQVKSDDAAPVAGPSSQPMPSSAQLRDAINQLSHLQRILTGDSSMSLEELLAATAAGGPASQSIPDGGLVQALPRLLAPLLPLGGSSQVDNSAASGMDGQSLAPLLTQEQASLLLARRAAFQPRQYLAMADEIESRTRPGLGPAQAAIDLGKNVAGPDGASRIPLRQRVLDNRKRKREALQQMGGGFTFLQSVQAQRDLVASSTPAARRRAYESSRLLAQPQGVLFAGERETKLFGIGADVGRMYKDRPTRDKLEEFLEDWHDRLATADETAARNVDTDVASFWSTQETTRAIISVEIASFGLAWITILFRREATSDAEQSEAEASWRACIEMLNIRAASEVRPLNRESSSINEQALPFSAFPLYRRLTAEIQAKASNISATLQQPWHPIAATLFCLAALTHLHERDQSFFGGGQIGNQPGLGESHGTIARGQAAVSDAIARWEPNMMVQADENLPENTAEVVQENAQAEYLIPEQAYKGQAPEASASGNDDAQNEPAGNAVNGQAASGVEESAQSDDVGAMDDPAASDTDLFGLESEAEPVSSQHEPTPSISAREPESTVAVEDAEMTEVLATEDPASAQESSTADGTAENT